MGGLKKTKGRRVKDKTTVSLSLLPVPLPVQYAPTRYAHPTHTPHRERPNGPCLSRPGTRGTHTPDYYTNSYTSPPHQTTTAPPTHACPSRFLALSPLPRALPLPLSPALSLSRRVSRASLFSLSCCPRAALVLLSCYSLIKGAPPPE